VKTWEKIALAAGGLVAAYTTGHVIHHLDKIRVIDRMRNELPEGARVLNVGCKNWELFKDRLAKFNVTNIDVVPRPGVPNFVLADIRDLSMFTDGSFDGILASHVLEHLPMEDVAAAVSEMGRVCRDHSKVYIVLPRWWLPTSWVDPLHHWIPVGGNMVASPMTILAGA
jgi:SAM-dependent methyltransferase